MQVRLRFPHPLAPGIPRMVTASATLHVIAGAAAIVLPSVLPQPAGPTWDVVLPGVIVDLPPSASPPPSSVPPTAATTPAVDPVPEPEPEPPPPPPVKKTPPPEASPDPPKPKPRPRKTTAPAVAKKPAATPAPDAAPPATGATAGSVGLGNTSDVSESDAGIGLSFGGTSFRYSYYTAQLINKLRANWQRPIRTGSDEVAPSVRIFFSIGRHGQVSGARIEISSSSPTLDSSALRAVYAAAPFPPLPPQFTEDSLHVAITFTLEPSGV